MRIIALPSIYKIEHDNVANPQKRKLLLGIAACIGIAVCASLALAFPGYIAYSGLLLLFWLTAVGMIAFVTAGRPVGQGERGEDAALNALTALPDSFVAITNCKIPGYEQIGDLDIVVISAKKVFIIEVKMFMQPVVVNGDIWIVDSWVRRGSRIPRPMSSPSLQLDNQVKAFQKSARRVGIKSEITGIIALNPNAPIRIENPPSYPVVVYGDLHKFVLNQVSDRQYLSETDALVVYLSSRMK